MGGVYDLFADGLLAGTFKGQMSPVYPLYLVVVYPIFFVAYSFMVLPPAFLMAGEIETACAGAAAGQVTLRRKYLWALLPLLGLVPVLLLLLLMGI